MSQGKGENKRWIRDQPRYEIHTNDKRDQKRITTVVEEGKNGKSGGLDEDEFFPKERGTRHAPTAKRSTNAATRNHGTTAQWRNGG